MNKQNLLVVPITVVGTLITVSCFNRWRDRQQKSQQGASAQAAEKKQSPIMAFSPQRSAEFDIWSDSDDNDDEEHESGVLIPPATLLRRAPRRLTPPGRRLSPPPLPSPLLARVATEVQEYMDAAVTLEKMGTRIRRSSKGRASLTMKELNTLTQALEELKLRADRGRRYQVALREAVAQAPELLAPPGPGEGAAAGGGGGGEAGAGALRGFLLAEFGGAAPRGSLAPSSAAPSEDGGSRGGSRRGSLSPPHAGADLRRARSVREAGRADPRLRVADAHAEALEELIRGAAEWGFDVFRLDELAGAAALPILGEAIFAELGLLDELLRGVGGGGAASAAAAAAGIRARTRWRNWLVAVASGYRGDVPYHGALHGADVAQGVYHFIRRGGLGGGGGGGGGMGVGEEGGGGPSLDALAAALLAALAHDVGHPGRNNKFLVASRHPLAVTYNDKSPLENMHAAIAFRLLAKEENNFLEDLDNERFRALRADMVAMILATDNDHHGELMGAATAHLADVAPPPERAPEHAAQGRLLRLQLALHAADLGNPAKPWGTYMAWTDRVMREFYEQGDEERSLGLPVSMGYDRDNPIPRPKFQQVFINYIVLPLYSTFGAFPGIQIEPCMSQLNKNLEQLQQEEKNETTASL